MTREQRKITEQYRDREAHKSKNKIYSMLLSA
jgi:hypothetical protein